MTDADPATSRRSVHEVEAPSSCGRPTGSGSGPSLALTTQQRCRLITRRWQARRETRAALPALAIAVVAGSGRRFPAIGQKNERVPRDALRVNARSMCSPAFVGTVTMRHVLRRTTVSGEALPASAHPYARTAKELPKSDEKSGDWEPLRTAHDTEITRTNDLCNFLAGPL